MRQSLEGRKEIFRGSLLFRRGSIGSIDFQEMHIYILELFVQYAKIKVDIHIHNIHIR